MKFTLVPRVNNLGSTSRGYLVNIQASLIGTLRLNVTAPFINVCLPKSKTFLWRKKWQQEVNCVEYNFYASKTGLHSRPKKQKKVFFFTKFYDLLSKFQQNNFLPSSIKQGRKKEKKCSYRKQNFAELKFNKKSSTEFESQEKGFRIIRKKTLRFSAI